MKNIVIGIIGCGNMGAAICERLKDPYNVHAFDKDAGKTAQLKNIIIAKNIPDLLKSSSVIIIAVKPQDFDDLMVAMSADYKDETLMISIAAGITTEYIENRLVEVRVVRVMPNMPAKIGKGMSCLCKGRYSTKQDLSLARHLFDNLGETLVLEENMMDAATAISGSGPGYYFDLINSRQEDFKNDPQKFLRDFVNLLSGAAEGIGFNHSDAVLLANVTCVGAQVLLNQSKLSAIDLRNQVASKGGATEAGLEVLHKGGTLNEAVEAALARSKELSRR